MGEYPYATVTGKLEALLKKIPDLGQPDLVDAKWLKQVGFGAANDTTILRVLVFVGLIDESGKPTKRWVAYRSKAAAGKVLGAAISDAYSDLFDTYSDAHTRTTEELASYFSTKTTGGSKVVALTVRTFRVLCDLADSSALRPSERVKETAAGRSELADLGGPERAPEGHSAGFTVNINVQLTLPETTDRAVYDNLFASLKRNLLE